MITRNWKHASLSEVCDINPGKKELLDKSKEIEVTFLPMASVSEDGKILVQAKRKLKEVIKGYTNFRNGDVLLAKITPCFENGKRAIAKGLVNGVGFGSTEFHVLRPREKVTSDWIFYAVSRSDFCNIAKSQMTGTAGQKRVPSRVLEQFQIPIPSRTEQEKISESIETQFTRLDTAIKSLKAIKTKLELYRKSVLKAAFDGALVKFDLVEEKPLGYFCKKVRQIKPENESFKDFFYVDIGSIDNKNQKIDSPKIVESRKAPSRARQETFAGDIVYSTVRVYLMNISIVPDMGDKRIVSSTGFTVLRPNKDLNNKFLFYQLLSDNVTRHLSGKQRGTSYPAIRDNDLFDMKITVPGRQIQDEIVQEIESRFSMIDKVKCIVNDALVKAETLRKSILKSAFEGKLVN